MNSVILVTYELPPLRAVYQITMPDTGQLDDEIKDEFYHRMAAACRIKSIVRSEIDDDGEIAIGYEQLCEALEKCPVTWLPSLLCVLTDVCTRKKVFPPGRLLHAVERWEKDAQQCQT